jgi:20S proteasome alpha/beta subunit
MVHYPRLESSDVSTSKERRVNPMTVLVGIVCKDGIVIAADSQESDAEAGMKRLDVKKIYDTSSFGFIDITLILAGTGTSAYIARSVEVIREHGYQPIFVTPRNVADAVENSVREMYDRYGQNLDLTLLLAVHCKNTPTDEPPPLGPIPLGLYNVYVPGVAEIVNDYTALGSGGPFARYLLSRFHEGEDNSTATMSVEESVREAVYVIEEVKKVQLHCGGETHVAYILKDGQVEHKETRQIKEIVRELDTADLAIKKQQRKIRSKAPS